MLDEGDVTVVGMPKTTIDDAITSNSEVFLVPPEDFTGEKYKKQMYAMYRPFVSGKDEFFR